MIIENMKWCSFIEPVNRKAIWKLNLELTFKGIIKKRYALINNLGKIMHNKAR